MCLDGLGSRVLSTAVSGQLLDRSSQEFQFYACLDGTISCSDSFSRESISSFMFGRVKLRVDMRNFTHACLDDTCAYTLH